MAAVLGAPRLESDLPAAFGQCLFDCEEGHNDVSPSRVELETPARNDVLRFHDQLGLDRNRIFNLGHTREPFLNELKNACANALRVKAKIADVVFGKDRANELTLLLEIKPAQLVLFEKEKISTRSLGRERDCQRGIVAVFAFLRIITRPDLTIANRTRAERREILPLNPTVAEASRELMSSCWPGGPVRIFYPCVGAGHTRRDGRSTHVLQRDSPDARSDME